MMLVLATITPWLPYFYSAYKLQEEASTAWSVYKYLKRVYSWVFPKKIKEILPSE